MPDRVTDHVRHNRRTWDAASGEYQAAHDAALTEHPLAWGAFRRPESELRALGAVAGKDMLELGCGGAQWSIALTGLDARCVGLDLSGSQLTYARDRAQRLPLVQGNGEQLPFAERSFDIVFCDHGAFSFCDPERIVPEAARVLRRGGTLAFCTATPLCTSPGTPTRRSNRAGCTGATTSSVAWTSTTTRSISCSRPGNGSGCCAANHFEIEDLIELRPAADATTTYEGFAPPKWARRWPAEWIWKARRR